eukprot:TRINITY_DN62167_c0_g1_i2.p1 TRINITY_DN62167_c0_g1~~TRINITY_DN62167_c0_g1_i2.p1  ORF type:complete len:150 (+),score=11.68 TRINITY_DN62167_c0_g1_i2:30-479(+)
MTLVHCQSVVLVEKQQQQQEHHNNNHQDTKPQSSSVLQHALSSLGEKAAAELRQCTYQELDCGEVQYAFTHLKWTLHVLCFLFEVEMKDDPCALPKCCVSGEEGEVKWFDLSQVKHTACGVDMLLTVPMRKVLSLVGGKCRGTSHQKAS